MSLNYRLPEHMTNGDLPDGGENHFAFCTYMMATGVSDLKTTGKRNNLALFKERFTELTLADSNFASKTHEERVQYLAWAYAYADICEGMTTNVSTMTDAQWRRRVADIIHDRGLYYKRQTEAHMAKIEQEAEV